MKKLLVLLSLLMFAEPALAHKDYHKKYHREHCEDRRCKKYDRERHPRSLPQRETCIKIVRNNITFIVCEKERAVYRD
jgi:hypothetical protein